MKAMIMAAGLGTRLKPWTLDHPKALVPVDGVPALGRLIDKLKTDGFDDIVVNVHHFSGQIKDYLAEHDFGVRIRVSDESDELLDTGGAIAKAASLLLVDDKPILVHNADILSNQRLSGLVAAHENEGCDITLLTSGRESSRKLIFGASGELKGWHNLSTGQYRPESFLPNPDMMEEAFSGIYVLSPEAIRDICLYHEERGEDKFPIMDYLLSLRPQVSVRHHYNASLRLLDIGKPEALAKAAQFLRDCEP